MRTPPWPISVRALVADSASFASASARASSTLPPPAATLTTSSSATLSSLRENFCSKPSRAFLAASAPWKRAVISWAKSFFTSMGWAPPPLRDSISLSVLDDSSSR